jgi:fatty acid desaturase
MAGLSSQWRCSHNYRHHMFTKFVGVDDDLGYGQMLGSANFPPTFVTERRWLS